MSSGDGAGLVGAVVAALVQEASRTAGEELATFGPLVQSVWQGLARLPRWEQAARRLAEAPGDDQARQEATEMVGELLALDSGLEEALAARWPVSETAPQSSGPSTVRISGSPIGGSGTTAVGIGNIAAGGNVDNSTKTVNRRGGGAGALAAVLAVTAAVGTRHRTLHRRTDHEPGQADPSRPPRRPGRLDPGRWAPGQ
ncbi:hypothetical protein ACWC9T_40210 [Kitasatospora sp. NPDC001159]